MPERDVRMFVFRILYRYKWEVTRVYAAFVAGRRHALHLQSKLEIITGAIVMLSSRDQSSRTSFNVAYGYNRAMCARTYAYDRVGMHTSAGVCYPCVIAGYKADRELCGNRKRSTLLNTLYESPCASPCVRFSSHHSNDSNKSVSTVARSLIERRPNAALPSCGVYFVNISEFRWAQ